LLDKGSVGGFHGGHKAFCSRAGAGQVFVNCPYCRKYGLTGPNQA
jgi:hypothetical protein